MKRYVGIFGKDKQDADNFLDSLELQNVKEVIKNVIIHRVYLEDGSMFESFKAGFYAKGHKFTDVYIQNKIGKDIIYDIIIPTLILHDDGTDPSINYFD